LLQLIVLCALLAGANAGIIGAPAVSYAAAPAVSYAAAPAVSYVHAPAIGASHQSTLRSLDGNSAVSTYSKAVDSAFSSVRKYDTRISNDAVALTHATYAAPAYAAPAYAAPAYAASAYAAPAYAAPAVAAPLGVAYSAAPAVAHLTFDGLGVHYAY